jgi:hypothetical protein
MRLTCDSWRCEYRDFAILRIASLNTPTFGQKAALVLIRSVHTAVCRVATDAVKINSAMRTNSQLARVINPSPEICTVTPR